MLARSENSPFEDSEQQNLIMQVPLAMRTMQNLDELFPWLASTLVLRFGVSLAQFWTLPSQATDSNAARLLASEAQDPSVPERVVANEEVRGLVERCFAKRQTPIFFQLEQAFSSYQAIRLNRYGFHYGGCAFLESAMPLVRLKAGSSSDEAPAPFAVTAFLFLWQLPDQNLWTTIYLALERGLRLAAERGLAFSSEAYPVPSAPPRTQPTSMAHASNTTPLRAHSQPVVHVSPPPLQPESLPPLELLIPHRKQDPDLLLATNPFTSAAAITDSRARRLYAAINGRTTVSQLCSSTTMPLSEAHAALQMLLKQQYIEIHDQSGQTVSASLFFKGF